MQEDTTRNHGDWKGRITSNNKILLPQAWFSNMLRPLVLKKIIFSMSVVSYFSIPTTSSSICSSSPIFPPLHHFGSLFFPLLVTLVPQYKHSRACCFALILSARLLISICHTGTCNSSIPNTSVFLYTAFIYFNTLFDSFLWKFEFAAFACFQNLLSLSYFIASSFLFSLLAANFSSSPYCCLNPIQYACTNSNPE